MTIVPRPNSARAATINDFRMALLLLIPSSKLLIVGKVPQAPPQVARFSAALDIRASAVWTTIRTTLREFRSDTRKSAALLRLA
jgi:hypothetical protein